MSSATALVAAERLPQSFEDFARHLRVANYPAPRVIIDQEPGLTAQFALGFMHLGFASVLIWHAVKALPGALHTAASRRLAAIPRTTLLAASTSGLIGWAGFITLSVLFIWR